MKKKYVVIVFHLLLMFSCAKNDLFYYKDDYVALNIWLGTSTSTLDSLTYNFAYTVNERDSVVFNFRLTGYPVDYDRRFELEAVEGDMNYVYYEYQDYILKAGQYEGTYPLYIDKPAGYEEFKDRQGYIIFKLKETASFAQGAEKSNQLHIIFKNYVAKPDNWDTAVYPYFTLARYFGTYSDVKYGFIIQETGLANFRILYTTSVDPVLEENVITSTHASYLKSKCVAALLEYNATHGTPLTDENGNPVVFP
jgi:hypothetical protein